MSNATTTKTPDTKALLVARALSRCAVRSSVARVAERCSQATAPQVRAELSKLVKAGHAICETSREMKSYTNQATGEESVGFGDVKVFRMTNEGAAWLTASWDARMTRIYGGLV